MNFKPSSPKLAPNQASPAENSHAKAPDGQSAAPSQPTAETPQSPAAPEPMPQGVDSSQQGSPPKSTPATESAIDASVDPAALSLDDAMLIDRHRLRRKRQRLGEDKYLQQLAASVQRRQRREAYQPKLQYPEELPISGHAAELIDLIQSRQVIVVCGETGSGKSTQLPKFCLAAGLGRHAMIGHTQPRRLAARSIASRLSEELSCPLGAQVGYQVRFGDQTGPETMIKLMTDGILLAETASDRFLDAYDAIIIDEAHERSLNIDFLLAYLRQLQSRRPDLKIIITSATIDAERFAEHFVDDHGPAPIVNVEGRGYPVEMKYLPWEDVADESRGYDLANHVIAGVKELSRQGNGDTLVFLPTERDIRLVSHRVAGHFKRLGLQQRVEILPLYARLPQKDQQRIFHPDGGKQRWIFATNVAESSLTVPGIRYVIDAGTARISRYSPRSKVQRLPIEPVSRASADQRAGRCGRIGPGVCVRLYSPEDYGSRDDYTTPEIKRTNLASVVLQCKTLGMGNLESIPLLDVPRPESIREGIATLMELGAIDDQQELTALGRTLGRMPVDPRIGRIILAAEENGVLPEVLPIAAAMELPDPRQRPVDQQQAADEAHQPFRDSESDFLSYLRLWRFYQQLREDCSRSQLSRRLHRLFLSPTRMREWSDIYRQLRDLALQLPGQNRSQPSKNKGGKSTQQTSAGRKSSTNKLGSIRYNDDDQQGIVSKDLYALIHQSLLAGFLSGVANAGDENSFNGARNLKLYLWPGSGLFESKPKWIVAAELVETTRQYARCVARIQPQWIEQVGAHLLNASYSDPHWSDKGNGAFCYQRLSLFGLPVVAKRRVPLPPVDPQTARDLLIQSGLVERKLLTQAAVIRHNRGLRDTLAELAAKMRRRDLVVDDYLVQQFYSQRLPDEVTDKGRLEKWSRALTVPEWTKQLTSSDAVSQWIADGHGDESTDESTGESAFMMPQDLIDVAELPVDASLFPDTLNVGKTELPIQYRYEPGAEDDGVQLTIPQAALSQISDDRLGWLVPGLLEGKIFAMIKSLPKRIRRNLVPAAEVANKIYQELLPQYGEVPFINALCQSMSRHAEMPVTASDFQPEKLEQHLDFLVHVVDDKGETMARDRSADKLRSQIASTGTDQSETHDSEDDVDLPSGPLKSFDFGELPAEVVRNRGGVRVALFPALVDQGDHVTVSLFPDKPHAEAITQKGLTRLYALAEAKELKRQVRWLPGLAENKVLLASVMPAGQAESRLMDLLARIAFVEKQPAIRSSEAFEQRLSDRMERISNAVQQVAKWLTDLANACQQTRREMEGFPKSQFPHQWKDIRDQWKALFSETAFSDSFLIDVPWNWLQHYPRYLKAIHYRIDKLRSGSGNRDAESMDIVHNLWSRWTVGQPEGESMGQSLVQCELRWMMEELRVSLFAQPLGTSQKISPARCEKWISQNLR